MIKNRLGFLIKVLYLLCMLASSKSFPQPSVLWTARYNGDADSIDVAKDITVDSFGNSYVTGYSYVVLNLLTNIVTIKYDPNGNQVWRQEYSTLLYDEGAAIMLDNTQQYVYVTGFVNGLLSLVAADYVLIKYRVSDGQQMWIRTYDNGLLGDDRATYIAIDGQNNPVITGYSGGIILNPHDYATIKYDQNGNQQWVARYNGPGNNEDRAYAIIVDNSDNVIVTGYSSNGIIGDDDYATVKYNSAGVPQWVARYDNGGDDRAYAIIVDNSDNVTVTGESEGSTSNFDYATVHYGSGGGQSWVMRYNGPGNNEDRAYAITVDNSDNVIVTGSSRSSSSSGSEDYATVKYNPAGSQQWASRYNGPGNGEDRAYAIIVDNSDNPYVTGKSQGTGSGFDYATLKYGPIGNQQWPALIYNGTGNNEDRPYAILVDNSDNIYVTGSSRHSSLFGSEDYLTIKYGDSVNSVTIISGQVPVKFGITQNYPNPFNPSTFVKVDIPSNTFLKFEIFDILGVRKEVLVNDVLQPGSYNVDWNAANYPSGVYFYKITTPEFSITKKMVLLK